MKQIKKIKVGNNIELEKYNHTDGKDYYSILIRDNDLIILLPEKDLLDLKSAIHQILGYEKQD